MKKIKDKIILQLLFLTLCFLFITIFAFFKLYITDNKDMCLDTGYCKEGLILNIHNKQIIVNKDTCIENNGKWNSDEKYCGF